MSGRIATVHIVDDDLDFARLVAANLGRTGEFRSAVFGDPQEFLERYSHDLPDAVIADLRMPGLDGLELTRMLRKRAPYLPILLLTGYGDIPAAIEALKAGATEFLTKPPNVLELAALLRRAVAQRPLLEDAAVVTAQRRQAFTSQAILGTHPLIEETRAFIDRLAAVPSATVLLLGESGTGKNLAAAAIHYQSHLGDRRLVEFNCSAVPAQLLESELFGYVKGAFTGAAQTKRGLVEIASGGTLFLDEIGDLAMEIQAKLLNFLESRTFRRLGGTQELQVGLRLITATSQDLDRLIREGRFRPELAYRIRVACHTMPALREIRSDIPLLAEHFRQLFSRQFRKDVTSISAEALDALMAWDWPGNVRELRNAVERGVIFTTRSEVRRQDLPRLEPAAFGGSEAATDCIRIPRGLSLSDAEREYIRQTLRLCGGNIQRTAEVLGITRKNLWEKRRKYALDA